MAGHYFIWKAVLLSPGDKLPTRVERLNKYGEFTTPQEARAKIVELRERPEFREAELHVADETGGIGDELYRDL